MLRVGVGGMFLGSLSQTLLFFHKRFFCCLAIPLVYSFFFFKILFYFFLERGEWKEREGEKHQSMVAFLAPPAGDLTHNPGMCPGWELNQEQFGSQASAQSTEPHQPGLVYSFYIFKSLYYILS